MDKQKIGIHIVSLVAAVFLFLSVNDSFLGKFFPAATTANYHTTWVYDVPIEVNYDKDKLYVLGIPDSVDVKLSGPISIVQKEALDRRLKAKLDFSNVSSGSEQDIKVEISDIDSSVTAVANPEFITVSVRDKISKDFPVKTSVRDERLLIGVGINSVTAADKSVKIYGAAESINNIYEVRAESSERTKISSDKDEEATLIAYDNNFNRIEDIQFEKNKTTLSIKVDKIEKSLPIKTKVEGSLPDDRTLDSITIEPSTAIIRAQSKKDLDAIKEIFVDVELSNIKEDTVELSNLKVYHDQNNSAIIDPNNAKIIIKTKKE